MLNILQLKELTEAMCNFLENKALMNTLQDAKQDSLGIGGQLSVVRETAAQLNQAAAEYRPACERGSISRMYESPLSSTASSSFPCCRRRAWTR